MGDSSSTKPGDDAPPGTPGTGENLRPAWAGTGKVDDESFSECEGSRKVTTGIGGG